MDVKKQIKILIGLQGFDAEILELNTQLRKLPKGLEELRVDVGQLEELVEQERTQIEEEDRWKAEKEEEHQFYEAQIQKLRSQLQSARGHKEAMALQRQMDVSRKQSADLEDEILQAMQAIEARRAAMGDHEASLTQLKEQAEAEDKSVQKQLTKLKAALAKVTEERDKQSKDLDEAIKRRYMKLASHGRHPSIVEADDGRCCGCNMQILPQLYNTLFYANSIETCPHCYRMIYKKSAVFAEEEKDPEK